MIKALLLDADGLTLQKHRYFSEIYSEQYNVSLDKIAPFFRGPFQECQRGKNDIKEILPPYLTEWGWQGTVEEFMNLWCETDVKENKEVLDVVQEARAKGVKCYLTTDQEKFRAEYIKNTLHFDKYFDGNFYSCDLGYCKSDKEFFTTVLQKLDLEPSEVMFWDDDKKNVEVAASVGILAKYYTNFEEFARTLREIQ